jgi:regulatory protein
MALLKISLKARALRYLSTREHSRVELARKLSRHAEAAEEIEALLDELEAAKLLSPSRFSESLVHRRASRYGNSRILSELQGHGIADDDLKAIKADLASNEEARAHDVWRKKFGRSPADTSERAKQMRFLQQRGFSHEAIQAVMRRLSAAED